PASAGPRSGTTAAASRRTRRTASFRSCARDDPVRNDVPVVTTAQREAFDRDGYVVVSGLLSADELGRLGAAVDGVVAAPAPRDRRTLAEKSRYEQSFQQCINLWEDHPGVRPLTFHQGIACAAATLLDVAALRLWHDQALYKEPGGRLTDAHQDQGYWPIRESDTI